MDAVIRFIGLHKRFGDLVVLRGVDLDIVRGQTTVVLGPSGSGKTVLLKHAVALLAPEAGRVVFDGIDLLAASERQRNRIRTRFGFLFQGGALFDSISAVENVMFPLVEHKRRLGQRAIRERATTCLRMVGLEAFADHMPADLSGGQKKRVALARAIALEPEVILYDEPTTGLDPVRADLINELILKLQRELAVTSLVVTHDMASAFRVGDRLVMLHEGRVHADAPPDAFRALNDPVVQGFIHGRAGAEELASLHEGKEHRI